MVQRIREGELRERSPRYSEDEGGGVKDELIDAALDVALGFGPGALVGLGARYGIDKLGGLFGRGGMPRLRKYVRRGEGEEGSLAMNRLAQPQPELRMTRGRAYTDAMLDEDDEDEAGGPVAAPLLAAPLPPAGQTRPRLVEQAPERAVASLSAASRMPLGESVSGSQRQEMQEREPLDDPGSGYHPLSRVALRETEPQEQFAPLRSSPVITVDGNLGALREPAHVDRSRLEELGALTPRSLDDGDGFVALNERPSDPVPVQLGRISPSYRRYRESLRTQPTEGEYVQARRPRGLGRRILSGLRTAGKNFIRSGGNPIVGALGGVYSSFDPDTEARADFRADVHPRQLRERKQLIGQAREELSLYDRIHDNQLQSEKLGALSERYDQQGRDSAARIAELGRRLDETERHNRATEQGNADKARVAEEKSRRGEQMSRARFILQGYRSGGPLSEADRKSLYDSGYAGAYDMPAKYDPARVHFGTDEKGEITMFVARPESGTVKAKGTGVKRQATGGGKLSSQQAGVTSGEVFRLLGKVNGSGRIAHPDLSREMDSIKKRVNSNALLKGKIEASGESVDDYARRKASESLRGRGEITPDQHPSVRAFRDWQLLRGGVDPQKFAGSVQYYLKAIDTVRGSGKPDSEQQTIINELRQAFTKATGGADLSWFQ